MSARLVGYQKSLPPRSKKEDAALAKAIREARLGIKTGSLSASLTIKVQRTRRPFKPGSMVVMANEEESIAIAEFPTRREASYFRQALHGVLEEFTKD